MVEFTIKCRNCGAEKDVDDEFIKKLSEVISVEKEKINKFILRKNLRRFKCSHCGEKDARLISYNLMKERPMLPEEERAARVLRRDDLTKTDNFDSDLIYD
ncbi:MAG TPA: hypothetical protein VJ951_11480 [Bacteroidales bacterium]|nr:hypothetical protein [Bacteroidales bacterium]